jgi:hypothetical protein
MAKPDTTEYPLLDAIAAIYAADEHQAKIVKEYNPEFDRTTFKPSAALNVQLLPEQYDADGHRAWVEVPAVSEFAKKTLGMENRWISKKAHAVVVTDKHREVAQEAIDTINSKVLMMALQGRDINSFITNMTKKMESGQVTQQDIGLLTYVPKTAKQYQEAAKLDDKKTSFMQSKALGTVGDKIFATVTIFNTRIIRNDFGESLLCEGHDDDGNLVTFFKNEASKLQFEKDKTYNINGRIKKVGETQFSYGAIVNTINYVRMTK